ncbi:MAG: Arm DNA-binding domain-containing protein [Azovibrio sp.]
MGRKGTGVEIRKTNIRIKFVLDGETIRERLTLNGISLKPTPANIKYANRQAEEIRRKIAQGTFSFLEFFPESPRANNQRKNETFSSLADLWYESKGRLSGATKDQYGTAIRFWKKLIGEETLIRDISYKILAAKIGGYPWPSGKTHNNYMIALRGIFSLEYSGADSMKNPINGIENMPVVRKLPDPLTIDERDQILMHMKNRCDPRVFAYFQWMFYTGMRPEEAIAIRWSDIDWNKKVVRVQRVRTFKGSERDGSKTHSERDVDLFPQALEALTTMKHYTAMLNGHKPTSRVASTDVFQNPLTNRPWHDERSQRDTYWKPTLKYLGIRQRRAYNTRHTFATVALMAGVPPAYIASQLGHSVKMLLERYARWIPGNDSGFARAMLESAMAESPNSSQIRPTE